MDIYKEIILDHYQNPRNHGKLSVSSDTISLENPSCGDTITMQVLLKDGVISDIAFEGTGCALSQAGASMLTEHVKGSTAASVSAISKKDILELLGIEVGPSRLKCVLLPLETLQKALAHSGREEDKS